MTGVVPRLGLRSLDCRAARIVTQLKSQQSNDKKLFRARVPIDADHLGGLCITVVALAGQCFV